MPKRKAKNYRFNAKRLRPSHAWGISLLFSMYDPRYQLYLDSTIAIIKDRFPKAKYHYLILPTEDITCLQKLTSKHLDLLGYMEHMADKWIKRDEHKGVTFRCGFHADASLVRLHLHVISDDMISPNLNSKSQWNAFTTDYFIKPEFVRESLKEHGKVILPSLEKCKEYKSTPLACHKCNFKSKNMSKLKEHLLTHSYECNL